MSRKANPERRGGGRWGSLGGRVGPPSFPPLPQLVPRQPRKPLPHPTPGHLRCHQAPKTPVSTGAPSSGQPGATSTHCTGLGSRIGHGLAQGSRATARPVPPAAVWHVLGVLMRKHSLLSPPLHTPRAGCPHVHPSSEPSLAGLGPASFPSELRPQAWTEALCPSLGGRPQRALRRGTSSFFVTTSPQAHHGASCSLPCGGGGLGGGSAAEQPALPGC